jgi:tetratricopeptide (TPR) repeat protein
LAKLIAHRRTLLVLDGLEPLQNPPGSQEGRLREPSLQALLRELAAFNSGLCVITTRLAVLDLADYEPTSALRRNMEQLSNDSGAKLLRALGVKGDEAELRRASDEFGGHCLALTLLGSFLSDAYDGYIRCSEEVSKRLTHDVRQGVHARKVIASYQDWFGEGPELSVLRLLGFFDRPADECALEALLKPPAIAGLTEPLTGPNTAEWRAVLSRLRRAKLVAEEDPLQPRHLDAHPLVREYFGEQIQRTPAWKEGNRRLYEHYRGLAPPKPDLFRTMEPLFLAVICGCQAGLLRDALHEVYIPRIQQGDASFAAKVLGARGALLSVLVHFFEQGRWGSPAQTDVGDQSLTADDQLFLLLQAGLYLTTIRGMGAWEARVCYKHAEPLCHSLGRQLDLYPVLLSKWRSSLMTAKLSATMQIAKDIDSLAQGQNGAAFMDLAYRALAITLFYLGDFESARQYTMRAVQLWCAEDLPSTVEEAYSPAVLCLCYEALCEWHFGEITVCKSTIEKALSLAKELKDTYALGVALWFAAVLGHFERNPAQVERLASDLIERATRQQIAHWLPAGKVFRGWARSASGDAAGGVSCIEEGIRAHRELGLRLMVPYWLAIKAEALYQADRISEALSTIEDAEALVERFEERCWCAELHRLRGVFLAARGAEETEIEASFREAIRTASEQKSVSLEKRAEATYAEYHRQKASASGGHGFRLPLFANAQKV